jgi:uncharacterized glyoxalase superfamily protein PhnB
MTNPSPASEKFHGSTSVSITVKDIQKSAAWYQNVVGFGVDRTFERDGRLVLVALKAGDVRINLNQDDGAKGWDRIKGLGFSVNIWTTEDIDAIANRIKASGGRLDSEPVDAPWGARYFPLVARWVQAGRAEVVDVTAAPLACAKTERQRPARGARRWRHRCRTAVSNPRAATSRGCARPGD